MRSTHSKVFSIGTTEKERDAHSEEEETKLYINNMSIDKFAGTHLPVTTGMKMSTTMGVQSTV